MIVSVTQIFKIEKALIENRQFLIKNDVERSLVEIHLFFGSLLFGSSYLIEIMYNFDVETFFILLAILASMYGFHYSGKQKINIDSAEDLGINDLNSDNKENENINEGIN